MSQDNLFAAAQAVVAAIFVMVHETENQEKNQAAAQKEQQASSQNQINANTIRSIKLSRERDHPAAKHTKYTQTSPSDKTAGISKKTQLKFAHFPPEPKALYCLTKMLNTEMDAVSFSFWRRPAALYRHAFMVKYVDACGQSTAGPV